MEDRHEKWELNYGAGQSFKILTLKGPKFDTDKSKPILSQLAERGSLIVREPRSYENDRTTQLGRHLSTTMGAYLTGLNIDYREVQAGFDHNRKEIWISTNTHEGNKKLSELAGTSSTLKKLVQENKFSPHLNIVNEREDRHGQKLISRATNDRYQQAGYKIVVLDNKQLPNGEHAERALIRTNPNISEIAGIKRPCGHCFSFFQEKDKKHLVSSKNPGATWGSASASSKGEINPSKEVTAVTKMRDGKLTLGYNTDSDSDVEPRTSLSKPNKKLKTRGQLKRLRSPSPTPFSRNQGNSKFHENIMSPRTSKRPFRGSGSVPKSSRMK